MVPIVALVLATLLISAADQKVVEREISGIGAFPLSAAVSSQWLTGPAQGTRPQPVIMVYYRGPSGWHDRKWQIKSEFGQAPALVSLVSTDLELVIEYGPGGTEVKVQGEPVDFKAANVFLVAPVGDPAHTPVVQPLGRVMFNVPEDANPAGWVLSHDPSIAEKVIK